MCTVCTGNVAIEFVDAVEVSQCHTVNSQTYCLYTNGSVLRWNEAREFCVRRNSTLPIITDENIDNVFQRFIVHDPNGVIQNRSAWIGVRRMNDDVKWNWINGHKSGTQNS